MKIISNLINQYVSGECNLDQYFITTILNTLLAERELTSISREINIYPFSTIFNGGKYSMSYEYPKGINVILAKTNEEVTSTIYNIIPVLKNNFHTSSETILKAVEYYYYIKILMMFCHEVEHVNQNKNYTKEDTLENLLVTLNLRPVRDLYDAEYNENIEDINKYRLILRKYKLTNPNLGDIEPIERFANINSTNIVKEVINNLDTSDEVKEILLFLLEFDKTFLKIYSYVALENSKYPLDEYIKYMKQINELYTHNLDSNEIERIINAYGRELSLDERLYYGFEITDDELEGLKRKTYLI